MARLLKLLLCGVAAVSFSAGAANNDDGFIWIDANTKIRLKPIGSATAGSPSGAAGSSAEKEEPKKDKKAEKRKK